MQLVFLIALSRVRKQDTDKVPRKRNYDPAILNAAKSIFNYINHRYFKYAKNSAGNIVPRGLS